MNTLFSKPRSIATAPLSLLYIGYVYRRISQQSVQQVKHMSQQLNYHSKNQFSSSTRFTLSSSEHMPDRIEWSLNGPILLRDIRCKNGSTIFQKRLTEEKFPTKNVHTIAHSPAFRTMSGIQKLVTEPTREHIENIRQSLCQMNAKNNSEQEITCEKDSSTGIASVKIRSAAKNGISGKMMSDFLDVIDELYLWDEGKGVIIYGHGGFFCSGGDLVSVRELANYEDGLKMATLMQYNLARLQALPMITMAMIEGKAIGGGAEIAVTTDLRLMTKSAKMGYVHCRVGIVAAWGGGSRLVQLIGPSRAVELMSSGRLVDAGEAISMGLVNKVIPDDGLTSEQVMDEAKKYLCAHLIGAKSTIIAMKGLVNAARTLPLEQALVAEGQILSSTWGKPPHIEALNNNVKHRDG